MDVKYQLVVKHFDKPGVLASVLDIIKIANINIEEIENIIFEGGIAACCTMKLRSAVSADMIKRMRELPDIISVSHVEL
jgi:D-3-phosphoglycerate dehydrogenase